MHEQETLWYQPNPEDKEDKTKRATHFIGEAASIESRQSSWHQLNLWNSTLFSNRELPAFRWGEPTADWEMQPVDLRTENLIESIGESFLSKAASSPLKPTPVPRGRSLKTEHAVRVLDDFVFGLWQQTQSEEACLQMFLDAYISGVGCVRVAFNGRTEKMHVESVFFDNLVIDNRECSVRQQPRTYRIRTVLPKAAVEARYGVSLTGTGKYVDYRKVADGWCVVVEAWRPPDENGDGGYYMVASGNQILDEKVWKEDWVPLVFFHWSDAKFLSGFYGKSGVEQLVPFQNRHNELNEDIERAQKLVCVPRLLANANSMMDFNQLDNEFGRILLYAGVEPKPFEWRTNIVDLYNERERNRANAFSHMGLSEQFAEANMPQQVRLDSSAGIREFHNMEDRRNLRRWSRFEAARMELAKTELRVLSTAPAKNAAAFSAYYYAGPNVPVTKIPYEAVQDLTEDDFSWTMDAVPMAAMSPAARRELLRDWTSRGLIQEGSEEARRMEGNSNLEREENLEMSSKEDIDLRVLRILEQGEYTPPTRITNVTYGIPRVAKNYHRLMTYEDVKPNDIRLTNHLKWIVQAIGIQQSLLLEAQRQQAMMTPFSPTQGMPGTNASNGPPTIIQGAAA